LRDWRNLPSFRRNLREVRELSLTNQENWFDSLQRTQHINYMFTIVDIENMQPIGAAGLLYINWIIRSADFSFYIGKDSSYIDNAGFAEEAARLLIDYGFNNLNLHKIWMELYEFDEAKIDFFLNSFGFKKEGILRDNCYEDGRYWDSFIISVLKNDCI
jgi:RimJ/RimL family protein N-acetyltransferase